MYDCVMEIKKIYFDMDGVLADFDRGVREYLNLELLDQEKHTREYVIPFFRPTDKIQTTICI